MWVTEHGYSAETPWQYDPAYRGGETRRRPTWPIRCRLLAKAGAGRCS